MPDVHSPFGPWTNFFSLTSTTAATLLGLMFVLITLGAQFEHRDTTKIRIYLTPITIYFGTIILNGAIFCIPNHTIASGAICDCLFGAVGFVYTGGLAIKRGEERAFYRHWSELATYAFMPMAAYGLIFAGGLLLFQASPTGLDLIAAGSLWLLALAVRNSWSIATTLAAYEGERRTKR